MLCKKTGVTWSEWNTTKSRAAALSYNDSTMGNSIRPVRGVHW